MLWVQLFDALNRLQFQERPHTFAGLFEVLQQFMFSQGGERLRDQRARQLPSTWPFLQNTTCRSCVEAPDLACEP